MDKKKITCLCSNYLYFWVFAAVSTDDVSCVRCETSYYCDGDGVQKMCGRCEGTNTTCDRDPTEHSFGAASTCTSCLDGWVGLTRTFLWFDA